MAVMEALAAWAKEWKRDNMTDVGRALLSDALSDLYTGDNAYSEHWRGFSSACDEISIQIGDAPHTLWIDEDSGEIFESEPECQCEPDSPYACACNEYVYRFDRRDIIKALVGKELAEYIR